jgi:NAD(P)-dependent dehydrogenase (short-subunit alcohol dehydrogenase family)
MKAMFRSDGKRALVTGAATGLGQAIAATLAAQGARVAISDKPGKGLGETAALVAASGLPALELAIDVRDLDQIEAGAARAIAELGGVDILVNNAGINRPEAGLEVDLDNWEDHYATNVRGGFFMAQRIAPSMMERGWGRIVFISSQSGLVGIPGQSVYCSTKGALVQLVRTLGVEWAKSGITVNSVAPTFVETDLTRNRLKDPRFLGFVLGKIPAGRLALPEEVAAAVAFLASSEAAMVNCVNLPVDGGWTAW